MYILFQMHNKIYTRSVMEYELNEFVIGVSEYECVFDNHNHKSEKKGEKFHHLEKKYKFSHFKSLPIECVQASHQLIASFEILSFNSFYFEYIANVE